MCAPLISVIVPIYNVEAYLDRCVSSIVNQQYRNLEIILVDDGSPDHCPSMCDRWAQTDRRIKVIHKENGGLSDARNAGMASATGELIGFVDSDDWISPDMYQLLYESMKTNDSDISACGVEMVWDDGTPPLLFTGQHRCLLDAHEAMQAVIEESAIKQPVWYKLYKADLVRDIMFPVEKYHEDVFWTYQAVGRAGRVSVFDKPCYFYTQRSGSIMGEGYSPKRLDAIEAKANMLEYITQHDPALTSYARVHLWFAAMYHYQQALRWLNKDQRRNVKASLYAVLKNSRPTSRDMKTLNSKQKIWLLGSRLAFDKICRIRNMLNIGV